MWCEDEVTGGLTMADDTILGHTHKCARCGKEFYIPLWVEYTYKLGRKHFCSYNCYSPAIDEYNLKRKKYL